MKLIIPMAGRGTRLRPHTHVTPKPLVAVAGASMIERIVRTFVESLPREVTEAVFILGDFPDEVNQQLTAICAQLGIKASFAYQYEAHGTAHAIHCAKEHLSGECVMAFADALFYMEPDIDLDRPDVVAWVKIVEDPSAYGVVVKEGDRITGFVEKPKTFISDEALIGIYYIKDGESFRKAVEYIIDNDLKSHRGEYEVTDAFDHMLKQGDMFTTARVTDWMDCGTIPALLETTQFVLDREMYTQTDVVLEDAIIQEPVYLGPGVEIRRSVVGPYASVEAGSTIADSVVKNSILFAQSHVENAVLDESLIGQHARVMGAPDCLNIGDHAVVGNRS